MTQKPGAAFPFILLPWPRELPIGFGINATSGPNGCLIQCRGIQSELDLITKAAERLGLPRGTFMRRIMIDTAHYVLHNFPDGTE